MKRWAVMIPIGIAAILIFTFVGGTSVKLLWNWLLPPLFGWPELTFWQALGMLALCRILFGGFGGHGHKSRRSTMSREEQERFRHGVRRRFGLEPPASESHQPPE
jgi:hypothetical protein